MSTHALSNSKAAQQVTPAARNSDLLQRKCDCGGAAGLSGKCEECVQTKLSISRPGDRFEREADRVAEQIMRAPEVADLQSGSGRSNLPTISRWVAGSGEQLNRQPMEEEEEERKKGGFNPADLLSMKEAAGSAPTPTPETVSQIGSMRGDGQQLNSGLRQFFEPRFGHDFSHVRIHTDARAAQTTKALNARAFTLGSDIAFAASEYKPETDAGRLLLAHELTHVVQQSDQVQALMRACDCSKAGAKKADSVTDAALRSVFPRLNSSQYCVTSGATSRYNCYAWTVGNISKWLEKQVDTVYGDNNGKVEISDFDSLYAAVGLKPVTGQTPSNAEVALYAKGSTPTHAARRRADAGCGNFESKLGKGERISHYPDQLAGGTLYGNINRYYVPLFTSKKP
jgi:Domain of unknown function (DUF4157)